MDDRPVDHSAGDDFGRPLAFLVKFAEPGKVDFFRLGGILSGKHNEHPQQK
jgi:hypothetical protein